MLLILKNSLDEQIEENGNGISLRAFSSSKDRNDTLRSASLSETSENESETEVLEAVFKDALKSASYDETSQYRINNIINSTHSKSFSSSRDTLNPPSKRYSHLCVLLLSPRPRTSSITLLPTPYPTPNPRTSSFTLSETEA